MEGEWCAANVVLLPTRFSQLSLWLFSSEGLLAMNALWITRFGVFVKENALVTFLEVFLMALEALLKVLSISLVLTCSESGSVH